MKYGKRTLQAAAMAAYFAFVAGSALFGFAPGKAIGGNFLGFALQMVKILPCAFLLIGLFEVWVPKEKVEKHLGRESGILAYAWIILLASTTVGGVVVAFPVAASLFRKGAKLSVVFFYLGASALCRIPMTIFEASFLGLKYSLIRLLVAIPLVYLTSVLLGNSLEKKNYAIRAEPS